MDSSLSLFLTLEPYVYIAYVSTAGQTLKASFDTMYPVVLVIFWKLCNQIKLRIRHSIVNNKVIPTQNDGSYTRDIQFRLKRYTVTDGRGGSAGTIHHQPSQQLGRALLLSTPSKERTVTG